MSRGPVIKFTEKQKRQILALRGLGVTFDEISKRFNVSHSVVFRNVKKWQSEKDR